jgi:hypothetical protein
MGLDFRFKGRKMNADDWGQALVNEAMNNGKREIERRVQTQQCPAHGKPATNLRWEGEELKFNACCDEHLRAIRSQVS